MKISRKLLASLAVAALSVPILTACSFDFKSEQETTKATVVSEATEAMATTEASEASTAKEQTTKPATNSQKPGTNTNKPQNEPTEEQKETQAKPNSNEGVNVVPTRLTVTAGNKGYTKNVGETFTYTCNLKTPKKIEDVQATVTYDSKMLELIDISFPVLGDTPIYNTNLQNEVKFNAINLRGFDFTTAGSLVDIKFKVIKKGGTEISTAIEVMSEQGSGNAYVTNYTFASGVSVQEVIK